MKPNFKSKNELVKTTFDGQSKPSQNINPKGLQEEDQGFQPLDQSLVGQRQFIFLDKNNITNNNSSVNYGFQENKSLTGSMQRVFFTNASKLNRDQAEKDKKIFEQTNAFKTSQKLVRQDPKNFKKAKSAALGHNSINQKQQNDNENEFLELTNVGKWHKGNKSTVISEEMKKMHNHLQNRLTETKWVKKKVQNHDEQTKAQTQKNRSTSKNIQSDISSQISNKSSQFRTKDATHLDKSVTKPLKEQLSKSKKMTDIYMQGISVQKQQKLSETTSWKQNKKQQVEQQQNLEDGQEQQQDDDQDEESQEEEDDEQEQEEEQSEEQEEQEQENQQDDEQSSGEEGWEEPEDQTPEDQEEDAQQNPFQIAQEPQHHLSHNHNIQAEITEVKAKKWENAKSNQSNPSILLQDKEQITEAHQPQNQIEDLTQGEIPNDSIDPNWQNLQQILLRIQKLAN